MAINTLNRRQLLAGIAAAPIVAGSAGEALAQQQRFKGRHLVAQGLGGGPQDIIEAVVYKPFRAETGADTTQVPLFSAPGLARMQAETENPLIDMFVYSGGQEVVAKEMGLTQAITGSSRLGVLPDGLRDRDGHWAVWAAIGEGILYRTDKIKEPPRSYKDFLKDEYKGHIAFPNLTNGYGVDFLVMLARALGGGENNVDPAFKALAKIKGETIFNTTAEIATLFGQNDIWLLPYDIGNAYRLKQSGLPIAMAKPEEGSPAVFISSCIAKRSKNGDVAAGVLDAMLDPVNQAKLAEAMRYTPTNPQTVLTNATAREIPNLKDLVFLDRPLILKKRAEWTDRFNREIAS